MCGIVGYIGFRDARNVLLECLKRLEYRGYDSSGLAIFDGKKIKIFKEVGEISNLEKRVPCIKGNLGIGHTRWSTHGEVNKRNAHPHSDCKGRIALVHNGIIENFKKLKEEMEEKGHRFVSDTDTEVVVHLIEEEYKGDLKKAVSLALERIKGSFAIVVFSENEPDKILGIKKDNPLVVGIGDNENFFASDTPAILNYTNRVIYLEDNDICVLGRNSIEIFNNNQKVNRDFHIIDWSSDSAEKGGFPHFMLKEIYEQTHTIREVIRGRVSEVVSYVEFDEKIKNLLNSNFESISIVACGTSFYAGLIGKYIIEELVGIPVNVELASEYRYFGIKSDKNLVIGITQSGETADTIAALREAKNSGCKTLVITNVIGSTAARIADGFLLTQSGPEICVAATKTFTSQIVVLFLVALFLARKKISSEKLSAYINAIKDLSKDIRRVLEKSDEILKIANMLKDCKSLFFIGRGINYPLSLEGALKLKEISYIHAEGFPAGELKHGPFALLTKDTFVIVIVTKDKTYNKIIANIGEIKARKAPVIAIADEKDDEIEKYADFVIRFPSNPTPLSCISIAVILQLLAYHTANLRGCEIDKPRNLAKSVTVE